MVVLKDSGESIGEPCVSSPALNAQTSYAGRSGAIGRQATGGVSE
jgi:hypothetical protein